MPARFLPALKGMIILGYGDRLLNALKRHQNHNIISAFSSLSPHFTRDLMVAIA